MSYIGKIISLRRLELSDAASLALHANDEDIGRFTTLPHPYTRSHAESFIELLSTNGHEHEFGIEYDQSIVGMVGLVRFDHANHQAELGYWLGRDFRGKGIMKEAVNLILSYGYDDLKIHKIVAYIRPANTASWKLLESAGFMREGLLKDNRLIKGEYVDHYVYGKINGARGI